jgi:hypothetical protein
MALHRWHDISSLGFRFDREITTDVAGMAHRYRNFLERKLRQALKPVEQAIMPTEAPIKSVVSQHAPEVQGVAPR